MPNKLYEARAMQRISQYVIALKTGIQQSRISLIENELVTPRKEEMEKIAMALGVQAHDIFLNEEQNHAG